MEKQQKGDLLIMEYLEFIKKTTFDTSYITANEYMKYIEPVYKASGLQKHVYCKRFYKQHRQLVSHPVCMMISAKSTLELENYLCGEESIVKDVREINKVLKTAFLITWLKHKGDLRKCCGIN